MSSRQMSSVTAAKKAPTKAKPGEVRGMDIRSADGGVTTHIDRHPPEGKEPYIFQNPEKPKVHADLKSLQDHVAQTFGGMFPAPKKQASGKSGKMPASDKAGLGRQPDDEVEPDEE